jgi:hypothetical protein
MDDDKWEGMYAFRAVAPYSADNVYLIPLLLRSSIEYSQIVRKYMWNYWTF